MQRLIKHNRTVLTSRKQNDTIGGPTSLWPIWFIAGVDVVRLFGRNVRQFRMERGLSQEELALEAAMKRSYLSDLERGTRNPSVRALGRLAEALSVAPDQLLKARD